MTILRYRGEVHPLDPDFSPSTHVVLAGGTKRTDYLVEGRGADRRVVIEGLTYFELRNIEIKPQPRRKSA